MLVTFKTDSYPNITLFGNDAQTLLTMLGHSGAVSGSIRAEDISKSLGMLKNSIALSKNFPPVNAENADEPVVSIAYQ
jgi:hypothetical protein